MVLSDILRGVLVINLSSLSFCHQTQRRRIFFTPILKYDRFVEAKVYRRRYWETNTVIGKR